MGIEELCMSCFEPKEGDARCPKCGYSEGDPKEAGMSLPPGTVLNGKYMVGKTLGNGGFGITYLGYDLNLEMKVAIKEYLPVALASRAPGQTAVTPYSGGPSEMFRIGLTQFIEEAKILARFKNNPHVVGVLNFFTENGTAYFVMDYIEGCSIAEMIRQNGAMDYKKACAILLPVMEGLALVHRAGFLHRDISPDNIYITRDGQPKLLDFGAARYTMKEHSKNQSVILKPGYAPEEQYRTKGNQGPWTDVYALGATLYCMVTGQAPQEALDRVYEDEVRMPGALGIAVPAAFDAILKKALMVRAQDRYQSVDELKEKLQALAEVPGLSVGAAGNGRGNTVKIPAWFKTALSKTNAAFNTVKSKARKLPKGVLPAAAGVVALAVLTVVLLQLAKPVNKIASAAASMPSPAAPQTETATGTPQAAPPPAGETAAPLEKPKLDAVTLIDKTRAQIISSLGNQYQEIPDEGIYTLKYTDPDLSFTFLSDEGIKNDDVVYEIDIGPNSAAAGINPQMTIDEMQKVLGPSNYDDEGEGYFFDINQDWYLIVGTNGPNGTVNSVMLINSYMYED